MDDRRQPDWIEETRIGLCVSGNHRSWTILNKHENEHTTTLWLADPLGPRLGPENGSVPTNQTRFTFPTAAQPFLSLLGLGSEVAFTFIAGIPLVIPYEPPLSKETWEALRKTQESGDTVLVETEHDAFVRLDLKKEHLLENGRITPRATALLTARSTKPKEKMLAIASIFNQLPLSAATTTVEKKLRIPATLVEFIEEQANRRGNDFTAMSREILYQWAKANGHDADRSAAVADVRQPWSPPRVVADSAGQPFV